MNLSDKLNTIAENVPRVYDSGYSDGITDGIAEGKQTAYDEFWESFQSQNNVGKRVSCMGMFAGGGWNINTFDPKDKLTPAANGAISMFLYCNYAGSENVDFRKYKHLFDFSDVINASSMFQDAWVDYIEVDLSNATTISTCFSEAYSPGHKTHITLKISSKTTSGANNAFVYCNKLTDLIFMDGSEIVQNIDLGYCPLNKASFESVFAALSDSVTGKTVKFKKTAKEAAFTDDEWATLIDNKPAGWTVSLV